MGLASETVQSNLRFSHQITEPLPPAPCLAVCRRGCLCVHSCGAEDVGYFYLFLRCGVWWTVCVCRLGVFLGRGAALEKGSLVSPLPGLAHRGFWLSEPTLTFASDGPAQPSGAV